MCVCVLRDNIFVQCIQTLSLCGAVVSGDRGGTGTRSGEQGGDRGGVPLGYFRGAGDSGLVSLTHKEILVCGFGVSIHNHIIIINRP